MLIKPLKVNKKPEYTLSKPKNIPPEAKNVSPFYVHLVVASRGYGKTWSILELTQNIANEGFYNRFVICSPTFHSDVKQEAVYSEIANKGYFVERYPECNEAIIEKIIEDTQHYKELWTEYRQKKQIYDKLKKKGEKALSDDEVMLLLSSNLFDEDDTIDDIDEETLFDDYPEWLRRNEPPLTHIFLDDCYSENIMNKTRNNPLIKLVVNGRHMLTSLVIATQSLACIPRAIRSNTQLWSIFPTKAKKDIEYLLQEVENAFPSQEAFFKCMEKVKQREHGFLYIDAASLKNPIVKCGYNETFHF